MITVQEMKTLLDIAAFTDSQKNKQTPRLEVYSNGSMEEGINMRLYYLNLGEIDFPIPVEKMEDAKHEVLHARKTMRKILEDRIKKWEEERPRR